MQILDGNETSRQIRQEITRSVRQLVESVSRPIWLPFW